MVESIVGGMVNGWFMDDWKITGGWFRDDLNLN
jgi:hypothetical protein